MEERVKEYIRGQLEDMIYILGLEIGPCIDRDWAKAHIKEEAKKL
jgi:hypothetical protein